MKFLHLSDIHFDPVNDGEDTVNLRKQFIPYLKEKNIIVDELFFTGDQTCQPVNDGVNNKSNHTYLSVCLFNTTQRRMTAHSAIRIHVKILVYHTP